MTAPKKPKLPLRLQNLNGLPEHIAALYSPDPKRGGFTLDVTGNLNDEPDGPSVPSIGAPPKAKNAAEAHRDKLVATAIERMSIAPQHREDAERALAKLIRVEELDGELVVNCYSPAGFRWISSLPGKTWADFDEFVMRAADPTLSDPVVKEEWLLPPPPPAKTEREAAHEDSELLPRIPKNIRLPHGHSQADFERAYKLAQERGGQVIFEEAPVVKPTRRFRPGKDVQVRHDEFDGEDGQKRFEQMFALAQSQGGELVFLDPPAQRSHNEFEGEDGQKRFEQQVLEQTRDGRIVTRVPPLSQEG